MFQTNRKWSKIRLRLHQRASITPELPGPLSGPWTQATRDSALVMCASRTYSAPLQKQFWPFQVALESHPALLRKSLRTPGVETLPGGYTGTRVVETGLQYRQKETP